MFLVPSDTFWVDGTQSTPFSISQNTSQFVQQAYWTHFVIPQPACVSMQYAFVWGQKWPVIYNIFILFNFNNFLKTHFYSNTPHYITVYNEPRFTVNMLIITEHPLYYQEHCDIITNLAIPFCVNSTSHYIQQNPPINRIAFVTH